MKTAIETMTCPRCGNQLPTWAQVCQFCGLPLSGVPRPAVMSGPRGWDNRYSWQEIGYIVLSVLIILGGCFDVAKGLNWVPSAAFKAGGGTYMVVTGSISIVLGLGLIWQQLWAQFVMKWYCVLQVLFGVYAMLLAWAVMPISGPLPLILTAVNEVIYAMMLYLIKAVGDVDP